MLMCTICGLWYPQVGRDTLDICTSCWQENFAGSQELRVDAPTVSETLEASALASRLLTLTPRQVQAMRRMHERWAARSDAAIRQWEEEA